MKFTNKDRSRREQSRGSNLQLSIHHARSR